ncbi:Cytochrome P450 4c3 [Araneus ventricosus]|uniref:Cytochrome P450 4c3 n=1 Tax=Araneus ventricosus TaxID=182803 RepID=A0A4Y2MUP1_ARAVE|nr:Cytochrome P450 4c3 [Araneus ventricosus]
MVLSNDQQYLYEICLAISRGECYSDLALRKPGPVVHSRWLTIAVYNFFLWPEFIFKHTHYYEEQVHYLKVLQDFSRSVIREKKDRYLKGGNNNDKRKRKALMDMLLERHFEFQDLNEEDIREEVDTFIMEGHDTTAVSLMWALFLIEHHPDVQSKLHEELDRTFGKDVDTPISVNDLNHLDYMECVIKESNRIYTVIPIYGRQFYEDTTICGYTIPKGSSGIVLSYYLHRDETVFPDPEKFDPDRFLPENEINIPDFTYIPFSAGPRNCIGKKFALMEMKTILAAILRRFELHSLDGRDKVLPLMQVTLHPSIRIRIRFRCRQ